MSKRENFYRRDPGKALSGMVGLSLEERGVYNTILDLLYSTWRPLEDNRPFIANWCGCAVQKLNPILRRLIERGRIITFEEDGRTYISDEAFEAERRAVKGAPGTASGRRKVGEKSGEVGEKSAGVRENPPLPSDEIPEKQSVTPLERQERQEKKEAIASSVASAAPTTTNGALALALDEPEPQASGEPWERDAEFGQLWDMAPPMMRKRAKSKAKVWPEWQKARRRTLPETILAGFGRYKALDGDLPRSGGPGLHIWLKDRTWEQWASSGEDLDVTSTWGDAEWSIALRLWRETGEWGSGIGPPPGHPGCKVPGRLLVQPAITAGAVA